MLNQWKIYEKGFPHYADIYNCDQEAAEQIAYLMEQVDREWGMREYVAEKVT